MRRPTASESWIAVATPLWALTISSGAFLLLAALALAWAAYNWLAH